MGFFKRKEKIQKELSTLERSNEFILDKIEKDEVDNTLTGEVSIEKLNVSIFTPKYYREIKFAAVHVKSGHPTVMNMEKLSTDEAKTALHFISGLLFAVDGTHVKLSSKVFLVMPKLLKDEVIEQIQNQLVSSLMQQ